MRGKGKYKIDSRPGEFSKKYRLSDVVLGTGSYARVQLGVRKSSGEKVAVKILKKSGMKKSDVKKVEKEVFILRKLSHKNVVRVFDAYVEEKEYFIVMEYVSNGDLFSKIVDDELDFTEGEARKLIRTIVTGLKYCKDNGVIHRDIKPDNVLMTSSGDLKIADFNLSKVLSTYELDFTVIETQCGTPNYVAPEVLSGKPYDYKCDIWSVGVITFLLLSGGFLPFFPDDDEDPDAKDDLLRKVAEGKWSFEPAENWEQVSAMGRDLVKKMLQVKPAARLTYEQVLAHPWLAFQPKSSGHIDRVIDTSSMTVLKNRVDQMRSERILRSAGTMLTAANTLGDLMASVKKPAVMDDSMEI